MNRNSKTSTVGLWTTSSGKVGLMYASDYALSLCETAKNLIGSTETNAATLKTGWMHQNNNVNLGGSYYEWTIARYGKIADNFYDAWCIVSEGYIIGGDSVDFYNNVRPLFYMNSDIKINGGTGSIDDPFILES